METSDKLIALITGASRGLGYQVAKLLGEKNMHVIGLARTVGGLEALSDEISKLQGSSTMVPLDIKNDTELEKLAQIIFERWKKIDIFIHCAGIPTPMSPVVMASINDFDRSLSINTRATLKLIQILDPLLQVSKIKTAVFLDDENSGKFLSTYSSSKAATREIITAYKEESARIGTKVIIFHPEPMPTSLRARFYPGEDSKKLSSCLLQAKKLIATANL